MSAEFSLLLLMMLLLLLMMMVMVMVMMMVMVMVMVMVTLLLKLDGDDLETHYRHTLEELGKRGGMLGKIFRKTRRGLRARFQTTQARLSGMRIPA